MKAVQKFFSSVRPKYRPLARTFSCKLASSLDLHYSQAILENAERISDILEFGKNDLTGGVCVLQKLVHYGEGSFEPKEKLLDYINENLEGYVSSKTEKSLKEHQIEEIVEALNQLLKARLTPTDKEKLFISNTIKAVLSGYIVLSSETQKKFEKILQKIEAKIVDFGDGCKLKEEILRQITISKQLWRQMERLREDQK